MADLCKEYGGALYLLAKETGKTAEFFSQLWEIKKLLEDNPSYVKLISSPAMSSFEKRALIEKAFGGKTEEYIVSFMHILSDRNYFSHFIGCVEHYKTAYYAENNISEGIAISAVQLTDEEKEKIRKAVEAKLKNKKLILNFSVDETLLGGFYVEVDGKVFDSSVKTKLSGLKEELSKH